MSVTSTVLTGARITASIPLFLVGMVAVGVALYLFFYAFIMTYIVIVPGDHGLMDEAYIRGNAYWLIPSLVLPGLVAVAVAAAPVLLAVRILGFRAEPKSQPLSGELRTDGASPPASPS